MATKEHPRDILLVCNIDVGCADVDQDYGHKHSEYFQVNYGGIPYQIAPGETKKIPRVVAEHYARHLADHMLNKLGVEKGKVGMITNKVERDKFLDRIIVDVVEWHKEPKKLKEEDELKLTTDTINKAKD